MWGQRWRLRTGRIVIELGRDLCANLSVSEAREWLVTNGIGGYAAGTIAGIQTRRYHGLLIAALKPPLARTLLVNKFEETIEYDRQLYELSVNRWGPIEVEGTGTHHLECFHLEGTTPVWTYSCVDALLEKRVWMQYGANTTYVRYDLRRGTLPLKLRLDALVNGRDHHVNTAADDLSFEVTRTENGLCVEVGDISCYLLSQQATSIPDHGWTRDYFLTVEEFRGLDAYDAQFKAGHFTALLQPGESCTIVLSTEPSPELDGIVAYDQRCEYERTLVDKRDPFMVQQLSLAADQFIVKRDIPNDTDGRSIIAGYPWFADWGRDTMISLPGLTLAAGRPDVARKILTTFAQFVDQGMLPNRFPEVGEEPEYNTVDATLWYFEGVRAYYEATEDVALLRKLFPVLQDIIEWHQRGTRYNIHLDLTDGLIYAGDEGSQLTWMDVKIGDWVVTPRRGKPIEINALWISALHFMAQAAQMLGEPDASYIEMAHNAEESFARFWNSELGYCYDVLDTPDGDDASLRPNQVIAISLPHCPLNEPQRHSILDVCARHLLTSHGLRSLAPTHQAYIGEFGGDQVQRDSAYHQGTVWGWLIGPFVAAHWLTYRDRETAQSYLMPLIRQLEAHCMGTISEVFEGNPPFGPRGCFAQAWSVAAVLRVWRLITSDI